MKTPHLDALAFFVPVVLNVAAERLRDAVLLLERFRGNRYFTAPAGKIVKTGKHAGVPRSWDEEKREFGKNPPPAEVL